MRQIFEFPAAGGILADSSFTVAKLIRYTTTMVSLSTNLPSRPPPQRPMYAGLQVKVPIHFKWFWVLALANMALAIIPFGKLGSVSFLDS